MKPRTFHDWLNTLHKKNPSMRSSKVSLSADNLERLLRTTWELGQDSVQTNTKTPDLPPGFESLFGGFSK